MRLTLKVLESMFETPPWDWPEELRPALLKMLRGAMASEKELLLAVELAGNSVMIDDDLAGALLGVLRNSKISETVRARAATSLGPALELADTELETSSADRFDDPDAVPVSISTFRELQRTLRELYHEASVPKLVRRRVLEASVRAAEDWHEDAIRAAYAIDDEEWKLTAVFAMRHVPGFEKQILESLKSPSLPVEIEAIEAAAAWSVNGAWGHLVNLVNSEDIERNLLLTAIMAVGELRPDAAPEVLAHLVDSDDPVISEAALDASSIFGTFEDDEDDEDDFDQDVFDDDEDEDFDDDEDFDEDFDEDEDEDEDEDKSLN